MTSRRGVPDDVYSDNGTNFVGANRELQELLDLQPEKIVEKRHRKRYAGTSIPQHHLISIGYEVMVHVAKRAINATLGNAKINDEELVSAVVGAEEPLNSRPLTYQSSSLQDWNFSHPISSYSAS